MKQTRTLLLICVLALTTQFVQGQQRYLDEVFAGVTVTSDTSYAFNYSILPWLAGVTTDTIIIPQVMDVYEPDGDTASKRPFILVAHGGTFLPAVSNGGPAGTKTDSNVVELCNRFARMGYVAVAFNNRLGWIASSPNAETKRRTILEAAYRGIQDARACIRFFRKSAAEDGNGFRIDPDRVAIGGFGTGGYLTYGSTFLKRFEQINLVKFTDFTPNPPAPYIDTLFLGDPYGIVPGRINNPNNPTYSSAVNMGFAMGGANGDVGWAEAGDPPFVAFHNPLDPLAPYGIADIVEPVNNDIVISEAAGGGAMLDTVNKLGLNDAWKNAGWTDPFTTRANAINGGDEGLFPLHIPFTRCGPMCTGLAMDTCEHDDAPWSWFNETWYEAAWNSQTMPPFPGSIAVCRAKLSNPNDPVRARTYMDTIQGYLAPRLYAALDIENINASIRDDIKDLTALQVFPNPAEGRLNFSSLGTKPMLSIELYDATGRLVRSVEGLRASQYTLERGSLITGMYIAKVRFREGVVAEKILLK